MGKIHKLSAQEAQKIAAGEVVERPYNIVKELVENALDAQATQITLYIKDGGKELIRCIDNGTGMSPEDARMSLEHHATSKLSTIDDLEHIKTFGFRGEALSSISAISKMVLSTHMAADSQGTKLVLEGATLVNQEIIAQSPGTDISVADIFFNVPARKKFLKTRETEWRAIYTLVQALALAHPEVSFTLYHDDALMLSAQRTQELTERVAQIFDPIFSKQFLTCSHHDSKNNIDFSGGITNYQYQRYDRNQQFLFVNKRWIKNYKLAQAFNKGFMNSLPPGKHPAGVIFITIDPSQVDINVHPRKEEVVFLHPRVVETGLEQMIQKRLERETAQRVQSTFISTGPRLMPQNPLVPIRYDSFGITQGERAPESREMQWAPQALNHEIDQISLIPSVLPQAKRIEGYEPQAPSYTIIGQLLKTYLLLETEQGLLIIDQHAAHESVLYEQFSRSSPEVMRVQLLFPEIIPLESSQQEIILNLSEQLHEIGIHITQMSSNAIAVTETPVYLKNYATKDLMYDIIMWVTQEHAFNAELWRSKISKKVYAMMACKAAVKAGDELSSPEIEALLQSLYKTEHRLTCPHGRPTTWIISPYELEKIFKRKV